MLSRISYSLQHRCWCYKHVRVHCFVSSSAFDPFSLLGNAHMVRLCAPCSAFFEAQTAAFVVCISYVSYLREILSMFCPFRGWSWRDLFHAKKSTRSTARVAKSLLRNATHETWLWCASFDNALMSALEPCSVELGENHFFQFFHIGLTLMHTRHYKSCKYRLGTKVACFWLSLCHLRFIQKLYIRCDGK